MLILLKKIEEKRVFNQYPHDKRGALCEKKGRDVGGMCVYCHVHVCITDINFHHGHGVTYSIYSGYYH